MNRLQGFQSSQFIPYSTIPSTGLRKASVKKTKPNPTKYTVYGFNQAVAGLKRFNGKLIRSATAQGYSSDIKQVICLAIAALGNLIHPSSISFHRAINYYFYHNFIKPYGYKNKGTGFFQLEKPIGINPISVILRKKAK